LTKDKDLKYLRIATILDAHGLKGFVKILILTDIKERFNSNNFVFFKEGDNFKEFEIITFNQLKNNLGRLLFKGIDNRNQAEALKGKELFISKEEAERTRDYLKQDEFYYYDLLDCQVFLEKRKIGKVVDFIETAGGEILVVRNEAGKENLIPFVKKIVKTEKIFEKKLEINPIEGLVDF